MQQAERKEKIALFSLAAGHFTNDAYSNFLGPLIPLLMVKLHMTMAEAGWLVAILVFSSSLMQPLYGYLSDRYSQRAFVVLSPLVTAAFMSFLGLADSYGMLGLLLFCGGAGVASFHPQGAVMTSHTLRQQRGFAMSVFMTAGSFGYALGPVIITSVVALVGLERMYVVLLPGLLTFLLLYLFVPPVPAEMEARRQVKVLEVIGKVWQPVLILFILVVIRATVQMCFISFLPLYLSGKGMGNLMVGRITTLFLACGSLGGLAGGSLADQWGERKVISISLLLSTPFLMGFFFQEGFWSYLLLAIAGAVLVSMVPVNVIMAQRLMPQSSSTVSALMMGFAWGIGGLLVPLVGKIADIVGLNNAFLIVATLPLAGFLLSLYLPKDA